MDDQDEKPRETFFKRILDATPKETIEKVVRNESRRETLLSVLAEHVRYYEMFADESDRGAAVLAHALFDDRLEKVLRSCNGALKGRGFQFRVKIEIAYALRLFDEETRNGLRVINKIRNEFAHSIEKIDFQDEEIAVLCSRLKPKTGTTATDLRERYLTYLRDVEVSLRRPPPAL